MSTKLIPSQHDYLSLALDIDRLMRRIHANLHPKARAVDTEKVGPLGGMILMTIEELEPVSLGDLSARLSRDKAQMTRHIQMLERKGLLSRIQSEEDRRKTFISLTDRGGALVKDFQTALSDVVKDMLPDMDERDIEHFVRTIQKMLHASGP